jgi:hypothetical protein
MVMAQLCFVLKNSSNLIIALFDRFLPLEVKRTLDLVAVLVSCFLCDPKRILWLYLLPTAVSQQTLLSLIDIIASSTSSLLSQLDALI